ncbi:MAG: hypothetical protein QXN33_05190, partial [Candidatus Bathyarchaeia archaeon]
MTALKEFVKECESGLLAALDRLYPGSSPKDLRIAEPPSIELGELSSSISFELAKKFGESPLKIAEKLAREISSRDLRLISSVEAVRGYVNFRANYNALAHLIIEEARS